ncbi:MAG: hypothetical protein KKA73_23760 [Chloroflexi bacterium]|nr:hypothetical protein [Chloroflexota bacterium]MBU1750710.1 hypothetical protein [Chloroflexota bacterium]
MRHRAAFTIPALLLVLILVLTPITPLVMGQSDPVDQLMAQLTVEEKVGQLFLVTFPGSDAGPKSDIAKLIQQYRVGGVVLLASNRNFLNDADTPQQVAILSNDLQALAEAASQEKGRSGVYVPLLVAVDQEGDGFPYTRIRGGMTSLPSNMAIGATWSEANAEKVGEIVGQELRALGVNLLLGPSIDVLERPRPGLQGDMGTRTFGGDPRWVGELGRAYIRGVHWGSSGRVATVAKHFPGHGGSDRSPDEEVATVEKSLAELREMELIPFFAVTQGDSHATTDALMSSHIRYRVFQGNVSQLTRPISFDPDGMKTLMALPEFATWRKEGVIVSDALGVRAVRRYYDPTEKSFPHKQVAKEAFLAGNDVLLLSEFGLTTSWSEQLQNTQEVIEYFGEEYRLDPAFKAQVDASVRRILTLKRELYPDASLASVQVNADLAKQQVGRSQGDVYSMARQAITLVYPRLEELKTRLPNPPAKEDDILIFVDARPARECFEDDCPTFEPLPLTGLQDTILQFYGPSTTGQVDPARINSVSLSHLLLYLDDQLETEEERTAMDNLLTRADWVIFAMLDVNPIGVPSSEAVKRFLAERASLLQGKRVVVLAYNAPYYLDATEISKLSAFFGIYSKISPFIEASARALFSEFQPRGASPVDVDGIHYDLSTQLEPDPEQLIQITLVEPQDPQQIMLMDTIRVRAGVIVDRNGQPVPDGTRVVFSLAYPTDAIYLPPQVGTTQNGLVEATFLAEREGLLSISAASGAAIKSEELRITVYRPTPTPSPTVVFTTTVTPPAITPSPTSTPTSTVPIGPVSGETRPADLGDLLLASGSVLLAGVVTFLLCRGQVRLFNTQVRFVLLALAWGLGGYILYVLGLLRPGQLPWLRDTLGSVLGDRWEAPAVAFVCGLVALGPLLWERVNGGQRRHA